MLTAAIPLEHRVSETGDREEAQSKSCHKGPPAGRAPPVAATAFTSLLKNVGETKTAACCFQRTRGERTAFSLARSGARSGT